MARALPKLSRTVLTRWIRDGRVRVAGMSHPPLPRAAVQGGERITIDPPPPTPTDLEPVEMPLDILHEDEHLLVLNKPSGLTVHPGNGNHSRTLAHGLVHYAQQLPELGGSDRPGIVHRLDKDTSGVIAVARTESSQRALSRAFAERRVQKTYLAWVHGTDLDLEGDISHRIERSRTHRTRMAVAEGDRGRNAETHFVVEARWARHTRVRCHPRTGRTHQLRVHLRAERHPIVGDPFYGWHAAAGEAEAPRLMLHAWRLAFDHPAHGEPVAFEAPIPQDLQEAEQRLAAWPPPR